MFKIGDLVKVVAPTSSHWDRSVKTEYIPIGTICQVISVGTEENGKCFYEVLPVINGDAYCYYEDELEKGEIKWVPAS